MLERTMYIWEADSSQPGVDAAALGSHPRYAVKSRTGHNLTRKTSIDWPAMANTCQLLFRLFQTCAVPSHRAWGQHF